MIIFLIIGFVVGTIMIILAAGKVMSFLTGGTHGEGTTDVLTILAMIGVGSVLSILGYLFGSNGVICGLLYIAVVAVVVWLAMFCD